MTSTMIEKVARAIVNSMGQTTFTEEEWANAHPRDKETALSWGRAAIEAMPLNDFTEMLKRARWLMGPYREDDNAMDLFCDKIDAALESVGLSGQGVGDA